MYSLIAAGISHELPHEPARAKSHEPFLPSRLDIQRRHLEHKKMYHLNTMTIDLSRDEMDRNLTDRQRIALANGDRLTVTSRFRHAVARFLVSAGERIQPEIESVREPRLNA
jgi:hypothetical protein